MSKKAITLYIVAFILGLAAGVITYLDYLAGNRAVEAAVAGTNAIPLHIGIAVLLVVGIVLITRRLRRDRTGGRATGVIAGDGGFWKAPFTQAGWHRLLFSLLALPVGVVEFFCSLVGAVGVAHRIERWRLSRFLDVSISATVGNRRLERNYFLIGLPLGLLLAIGGYLAIFTVWRAGLQVVGAFDPNFCINAWGGPTYLGASGAHWMDAFVIFYTSVVVVRFVSARQGGLAKRLLGGSAKTK